MKFSQQPKPQPNNRYREYTLSFPAVTADAIKRAVAKALAAPASEEVETETVAA